MMNVITKIAVFCTIVLSCKFGNGSPMSHTVNVHSGKRAELKPSGAVANLKEQSQSIASLKHTQTPEPKRVGQAKLDWTSHHLNVEPVKMHSNARHKHSRSSETKVVRKRGTAQPVTECIFMTSEEGDYYYKSTGSATETCGIYVIAEPGKKVVFSLQQVDVSCKSGGLISLVDGWELNGEFFPSAADHQLPMSQRFSELCGKEYKKSKRVFEANQNVALLQYRIPKRAEGFKVSIIFVDDHAPCNVLMQSYEGIYTLNNKHKRSNCTVAILFPSQIQLLNLNTGVRSLHFNMEHSTGLQTKCQKRGVSDYIEFIGSNGLDPLQAIALESFCGLDSYPKNIEANIFCGTTSVRLVSSGHYDNTATISFRQLQMEDLDGETHYICP